MTPWVALALWGAMVATLLRTGTAVPHIPGRIIAEQSDPATTNRAQARARETAGVLAIFAAAPLVFLLAVRRDVGTDFANYVEIYEHFHAGESLPLIEPLYATLNRLAGHLGPSGVLLVFAVSAALAALPLFYRVFRSSPVPWLGTVILFGLSFPFFMTNGVRSAIAIGIVMLVLPAIWRRQLAIWSLGILLAAGFHFTALLVWPLYWVLHLAWPRILVALGLAGSLALSTNREIGVVFLSWAQALLPSKYAHYPSWVLEQLDTYEFGFGYLIYVILAGLLLVFWGRTQREGREVIVFRNATILSLALAIGLYQFWAVNRLALYFMPALAVFLPWMVTRCVTSGQRMLWAAGFSILFGLMFVRGLLVGSHDAVPYQWIL